MNRGNFTLPGLVLTFLLGLAGLQGQQLPEILISYPDMVLYNGKIITAEKGPGEESQDRVFGPEEKISRMEALYMHTKWGALRSREEELLGTIEPGKLADLAVLGGGLPECAG